MLWSTTMEHCPSIIHCLPSTTCLGPRVIVLLHHNCSEAFLWSTMLWSITVVEHYAVEQYYEQCVCWSLGFCGALEQCFCWTLGHRSRPSLFLRFPSPHIHPIKLPEKRAGQPTLMFSLHVCEQTCAVSNCT